MEHRTGIAELASDYDGFIVDLWGVVHDGVQLLDGARDCLIALREAGKRVVFLSNAPRRARLAIEGLRRMGIEDALHDGVLTSGEVTRTLFLERRDPFVANLGTRAFHIGPERDANILEDTDLVTVGRLADAQFVLNTGPDDERPEALGHYRALLREARSLSLPMLCANPDIEIIRGGVRIMCAGALARIYETELGGAVKRVGKPDPLVYPQVLDMLGSPASRTLAVGDSLATDIAGANAAGIASVWVLGGIHNELLSRPDLAQAELAAACLSPRAILPAFNWS